MPDKPRPPRVFAVWAVVIALIRLVTWLAGLVPWVAQVSGALTAVILIYPPVIAGLVAKTDLPYWRLNRAIAYEAVKWFAVASLAVFPLAFAGNHFYQRLFFGVHYAGASSDLWGPYVLSQVFLVGFPEEFFFRGYLQGALSEFLPPRRKILGVPFGGAQGLASLLFAISHSLISFQWWHGFIFFPSLIFAWLKEKTGTIWAGSLFHAACNAFAYWVALHYRVQ